MIFGNKEKIIEVLKEKVEELEGVVTSYETRAIERGEELRKVSNRYQDTINELKQDYIYRERTWDLEQANLSKSNAITLANKDEEYTKNLQKAKEATRSEFRTEIKGLEDSNKKLVSEVADVKGKYEGVLLLNKGINLHIDNLNKIIASLTGKLPEVSANIKTTGDTSVTVNK